MNHTYLPEIDDHELRRKLLAPDSEFLASLEQADYERLGLDRALLIAADIALRTGRCEEYSILDAGANNGLIGRSLAVLGNQVQCIDSGVIDHQQFYEKLCRVEKYDVYDYLTGASGSWDFVLLLSVAHHWETGYAGSGEPIYTEAQIREIFDRLHRQVRIGVYVEMPLREPGFETGYTDGFMKKYCAGFNVTEINRTIGTNGFLRRLYYLDIAGLNRDSVTERLLRNAHLYEKQEMTRLTLSRAAAFELRQKINDLEKQDT